MLDDVKADPGGTTTKLLGAVDAHEFWRCCERLVCVLHADCLPHRSIAAWHPFGKLPHLALARGEKGLLKANSTRSWSSTSSVGTWSTSSVGSWSDSNDGSTVRLAMLIHPTEFSNTSARTRDPTRDDCRGMK